jgi:hypothetical protein
MSTTKKSPRAILGADDEHRLISFVGDDRKRLKMACEAGLSSELFKNGLYANALDRFIDGGPRVPEQITLTAPAPLIVEDCEAIAIIEKMKLAKAKLGRRQNGGVAQSDTTAQAETERAGNELKPVDRAKWFAQVLGDIERLGALNAEDKISPYDYTVAVLIGQRADKTGVAFPGYAYLARKAAVTVRFVQDSVRRLERHGHLRIDRHREAHFKLTLRPPE